MLLELSTVFLLTSLSLYFFRKFARLVGLVDKPNARKLHTGAIPLVGGLSVCTSLILFVLFRPEIIPHSTLFILCIFTLTILGALDDKYDVSFKVRLAVQAVLSLIMIYFGKLHLFQLGDVFGLGEITLNNGISTVFTIFAVIGAINAFNMVDGIDGLLGGLATVSFCSIAFLLKLDQQYGLAYLCAVIAVAMLPYIMMNLGLLGRKRKVFMGDAGSMLIGFSIVWILFGASQQSNEPLMRPVTALWLIAMPLIDMAAIMIRRIRRGDSPFKPDREHLHHIFQRLGLSPRQTLLAICLFASLLAGFGIYGELNQIPEYTMFYLFIALFAIYLVTLSYIWRITSFFRRGTKNTKKIYYQ